MTSTTQEPGTPGVLVSRCCHLTPSKPSCPHPRTTLWLGHRACSSAAEESRSLPQRHWLYSQCPKVRAEAQQNLVAALFCVHAPNSSRVPQFSSVFQKGFSAQGSSVQ